jgi:hypothetical protein
MITDCTGAAYWYLGDVERVFIRNTIVILTIAMPAAAVMASYRLYGNRRRLMRPVHSTLGLTGMVETETALLDLDVRFSVSNAVVYAASSIVAFAVGYLAYVLIAFFVG